jgi:5-bromo-4-chloroindolyl phosphate hydrolysis protein
MYTNKNFGFDDSLLNAVRGVVAKNRYMTKTQVETNIDNGLWQAETELVEGKIAYIYENTTRTRNKIVIVAEAKVKDENIGRFQETFINKCQIFRWFRKRNDSCRV